MNATTKEQAPDGSEKIDDYLFTIKPDGHVDPLAKLAALGLKEKAAELDAYGYTMLAPEEFDDRGVAPRLVQTILRLSAQERGIEPDLLDGSSHVGLNASLGEALFYALERDPVFEDALMTPAILAVAEYLLGESCVLNSMTANVRGPGAPELSLHTDTHNVPPPLPFYGHVCNAIWMLTDVTPADGSTFFWPGSHKFCRRPTAEEMAARENFVPITAKAGSLLFWHGNTWHGALEKRTPGLRISLVTHFCRPYLIPQNDYRRSFSAEAMARHPARFRELIGADHPLPWPREDIDWKTQAIMNARSATIYG